MSYRVLLVEDDNAVRFGVARHLQRSGFVVDEAATCETARERFQAFHPDAVVTDFQLPDGQALELISEFRRAKPALPIVVFTGHGSIELAVRAVKTGADNLLTKPVNMDQLVDELRRACDVPTAASIARRPIASGSAPSGNTFGLSGEIERLKDTDCSLLILGETGTGKTMLARWLHEVGRRRDKPFVDLNCAGLARDLVESELFGHERGAFTSAHAAKPGTFELADGGTLFLDEIGDIDMAVQPKILKAVEEKRFRRMGSGHERTVDVRIIAATHRDLREATRTNAFRSDLYYRLSTVTITIPSLRERRGQLPSLARDLLTSLSGKMGRTTPALSPDAEAALQAHSWPGNVRELKNVLERALHFTVGDVLHAVELQVEEPTSREAGAASSTLRAAERAHIESALAACGHVGDAAQSLGISRSSMYLKLKAYGIAAPRSASRIKLGGAEGV